MNKSKIAKKLLNPYQLPESESKDMANKHHDSTY